MLSKNREKVREIVKKYDGSKQKIIFMLHDIKNIDDHNQIKEEYAEELSKNLNTSMSEVYDIITFYSMFNKEPMGKYIIEVCNSGPCFVSKGKKVAEALEKKLGIKMGDTTSDNLFTLKYTSCIGACDVAPAMKIGDEVYGNLTEEKIEKILEDYRSGSLCIN